MPFTDEEIQQVWEKGAVVPPNDPNLWRKDFCGAWIYREYHGNRNSQYGWEIDHIILESEGGGDELTNLRPFQWENNAARQPGSFDCVVTSSGVNNARVR